MKCADQSRLAPEGWLGHAHAWVLLSAGLTLAGCSWATSQYADADSPPTSHEQGAPREIGRDNTGPGGSQLHAPADELLITFKPGTTESRCQAIHQAVGARLLSRMLGGRIAHVKLPPGQTLAQGQAAYVQFPEVVAAEPNYPVEVQGHEGQTR